MRRDGRGLAAPVASQSDARRPLLHGQALEDGIPYQTLIASVLHKFVTGRLVEREVGGERPAAEDEQRVKRSA